MSRNIGVTVRTTRVFPIPKRRENPWASISREVEAGIAYFWAKRGGRPSIGEFNCRSTSRRAGA